jgi:hypothetical protein
MLEPQAHQVSQEIKELLAMMEPLAHQAYREPLEFKDSRVPQVTWVIQVLLVLLEYKVT